MLMYCYRIPIPRTVRVEETAAQRLVNAVTPRATRRSDFRPLPTSVGSGSATLGARAPRMDKTRTPTRRHIRYLQITRRRLYLAGHGYTLRYTLMYGPTRAAGGRR